MNKAELIGSIAGKSGLSKADAGRALDAFVDSVTEGLSGGERIALVGFGSWSVEQRDARTGRNPRTGEEIQIAAKKVVKFKAGAGLSDAVN
ncbi:MAG: HU family DNA-binding protein [Chloroflexi bacterium]|nr:HU family DNA-binding protein [Chloroflexota bacterium]